MFWALVIGLYLLTFPLNLFFLSKIWYKWYPVQLYEDFGESVDNITIKRAQIHAILLFGLLQPFLATVPLLFGNRWWHYLICLLASAAYASSGSPRTFLDRVRSSLFMRLGTLVAFSIGAIIFSLLR